MLDLIDNPERGYCRTNSSYVNETVLDYYFPSVLFNIKEYLKLDWRKS
jgi:hypothetical protein